MPDPAHRLARQTHGSRELAGGPVGQPLGGSLERERDDLCPDLLPVHPRPAGAGSIAKAGQALAGEAVADPAHLHRGIPGALGDRDPIQAVGDQEHRARPPRQTGRPGGGALQLFQPPAVGRAENDRQPGCAHRPPSAAVLEAILS